MKEKRAINVFFPFRSFHNQAFNWKVAVQFFIPPVLNIVTLFSLKYITLGWGKTLAFLLKKLEMGGNVVYTQYYIFNTYFSIPSISMPADNPDAVVWWYFLIISLGLLFISFFMPERYTPLIYFLRTIIFVLFCSLVFFLVYPTSFPYNIYLFTKTGFLQVISILFGLPWIYCLTYYLFNYKSLKKIGITLFVLIYFILMAPLQYLICACLIHLFSLFIMPVLYVYAGLLLNVFSAVAFFAYGVSIQQTYEKFKI